MYLSQQRVHQEKLSDSQPGEYYQQPSFVYIAIYHFHILTNSLHVSFCALLFRLRLDKSVSDEEIDSLTDDILENLGLSHVADNLVGGGLVRGGLSGGEKKRVQCGIELVTSPEIIVLDEPTSGKSYLPCHPSLSTSSVRYIHLCCSSFFFFILCSRDECQVLIASLPYL